MLAVQVQYLQYAEGKRHNLVTEQLGYDNLNENVRHNKESETISLISANAQATNAQTNRKLANAQVPLINAQADQAVAQTDLTRTRTAAESYNIDVAYSNAKIQQSNAFWAPTKNFSQVVNNLVPF